MNDGGYGDASSCGGDSLAACAIPVAGHAEAAYVVPGPAPGQQVVRGVEINMAPVSETAKERRLRRGNLV